MMSDGGNDNRDREQENMEDNANEVIDIESWSVDQAALERKVAKEADETLRQRENELDQKRLDKTLKTREEWQKRVQNLRVRLADRNIKISQKEKLRADIEEITRVQLGALDKDVREIQQRMSEREEDGQRADQNVMAANVKLPGESDREFLLRTGKITPFAKTEDVAASRDYEGRSHQQLRAPGQEFEVERVAKRRRVVRDQADIDEEEMEEPEASDPSAEESEEAEEYRELETSEEESEYDVVSEKEEPPEKAVPVKHLDDGDEDAYQHRVKNWIRKRQAYRSKMQVSDPCPEKDEWFKPHPTEPDHEEEEGLRIPGDVYSCLFEYQKTGVQWLWELYCQKVGGIVGDEMGLGKTVQIAAFLAALHYSGKLNKPALIVCPVTVLRQWVSELHRWWPPLRVAILHSIGSAMVGPGARGDGDDLLDELDMEKSLKSAQSRAAAKRLIERIQSGGHVIVTTYAGMRVYAKFLLPKQWGYCVLDEGHKIRNPNADVSLTCKQVKTPHRIILSGTPIQNNLTELWSLFDFVFPGRLGTLPVFQTQFAVPINVGGYANATNVQVQTAYKCAVMLRDMIAPYMLRRMKVDVAADLPDKQEKVLFCRLTQVQADAYRAFLNSEEMKSILSGKRQVLFGIDILRKICNHPDLVDREILMQKTNYRYGSPLKSGKMQVVKALLELWKTQGHKTLLFAQTRQMLDILDPFVASLGLRYIRMDGTTPIAIRQTLVDRFNSDESIDLFLLTTKVGGLGVNLTAADRVVIFDPDWNPSTDVQARERAWRLGQKREVVIYRLLTAGAIEEKIYHRQIFKQFLTNKILKDPRQRRFFKTGDLHDLFTLGESEETETGGMFSGSEKKVRGTKDKGASKVSTITYPGSNERVTITAPGDNKEEEEEKEVDDLEQINGVAGLEEFQQQQQQQQQKSKTQSSEDSILEGIFAKSGVHSTLEHDAIMEASRPETMLIEREANRVATLAAKALQESRRVAKQAKIGTPTWTGRFGSAGKAGNENKKSSSSSILNAMKEKRALEINNPALLVSEEPVQTHTTTLQKICQYLNKQRDYKATSADIIRSCGISMKDAQQVATMRQMLRQVAKWSKDDSTWGLKEDYVE